MSRIHYEDITLEEVIQSARGIYVVKPRNPLVRNESIDIRGILRKAVPNSMEKYPPYNRSFYCFEIVETLHGRELSGQQDVLGAHDNSRLHLHKKYYLEGLSKSPVYSRYEKWIDDMETREYLIIFVWFSNPDSVQLVCDNAIESMDRKEDILNLIKSKEAGKTENSR